MNTTTEKLTIISQLNDILTKIPKSKTALRPDNGSVIHPGQIWKIKNENTDFHLVMIIEEIELDNSTLYNVAPLFRWTEKAGPEDLFLPKNFCGTPMIISFELEFTLTKNELSVCKGILDKDELNYIIKARTSLNKDEIDYKKFTWGWEYLDEVDNRYIFHQKVADEIQKIQIETVKCIFDCDDNESVSDTIIPFESNYESEIRLAAATRETPPRVEIYSVENRPDIEIEFSEIADCSDICKIRVYNKSGNISSELDGCKIYDIQGNELAEINNANAELKKEKITKGINIISQKGNSLKLKLKQ